MPLALDSVTLIVMATDNCNLECRYCSTPNDSGSEVAIEDVDKVLAGLKRLFATVCVGISGGEPTLHSRFQELVEVVAKQSDEYYLVTNGLVFDRVLPVLLRHQGHLTHVLFSLEDPDRERNDRIRGQGSFDAVMEGFRLCHEAGIRTSLGCSLNRGNLGQIDGLLRMAEQHMVVDGVYCWPAFPTRSLLKDGLLLTEADRNYLVKRAQQRPDDNQVIFGDIFRFESFYQECAPLRHQQFTLSSEGKLSFCCNLTLYKGGTGKADELGAVSDHDVSDLVERHIEHARDYQKALLRDVLNSRCEGLAGYPCFHCQRYHGKLDWLDVDVHRSPDSAVAPVADPKSE